LAGALRGASFLATTFLATAVLLGFAFFVTVVAAARLYCAAIFAVGRTEIETGYGAATSSDGSVNRPGGERSESVIGSTAHVIPSVACAATNSQYRRAVAVLSTESTPVCGSRRMLTLIDLMPMSSLQLIIGFGLEAADSH
jgi:hypothetical protein